MIAHTSKTFLSKKSKSIIIRNLLMDDAEKLHSFFQKSAIESTHTLHYPGRDYPITKCKARIETALNSSSEIFLGAFDNEKLIGQIYLRVPFFNHPWIKHIGEFGMIILKDYWGEGIGKELLNLIEEYANIISISRIEAKIRTSNERGLLLYKKMGYEIEGTRKKAAFINGQFEDEFFIAKLLSH